MNKENTEKLFEDFPKLYGQDNDLEYHDGMHWGFECGDGWFDLIYELSEQLSKISGAQATQVKEKFGTLRFYMYGHSDKIRAFIDKAEVKSANTCDVCGLPGKLRGDGWLRVRCEEHK